MNATEILATVARAESHRFIGRLGADPEIRSFQSGSLVCNARVGINHPDAKRDEKDKTDWFKVELWNQDGEDFANGAHRGDLVELIGRIKTEKYTDRQGEPKVALVIKPETWRVLRQAGQPAAAPAPAAAAASSGNGTAATTWQSNPASDPIDDEIPF